jgi:acetolactate synthase-1/2/3 large subunit
MNGLNADGSYLGRNHTRAREQAGKPVAVDAACEALTGFGLYPSEIRAACVVADTVEGMVRALLSTSAGGFKGLTIGLIEDTGRRAFATALAAVTGSSAAALERVVADALPDLGEVLLTGAEAVGLALRRSGVNVVFGYAGTTELLICDTLARLGLLVNGRGDRESLFQAGGASRLRPGNGAAVLHGARGLTNALGALADLRRNEIGMVAVVGLPATGSQPYLPPHGEPDLVPVSGAFAKSWYELGAVPEDPDDRRAAVTALVTAVADAVRDAKQPPRGPVLLAIPQDAAEATWVPLNDLPRPASMEPEPIGRDDQANRSAAALVAAARRPVVLIDDYALAHEGLRPALAAFCERTGAPVLQVRYRRGAMLFERVTAAEVPGFLDWYDPADHGHQSLLAAADLLITVEDRNMYPRVVGELPDCRKIALTSKPVAVRKNSYLKEQDLLLHTDVVATLREFATVCPGKDRTRPWYTGIATDTRGPVVPEEAAVLRTGIARAISKVASRLTRRMVLVDDSQMFGGLLSQEYDSLPPGLRVFGSHGGFVGGGITLATGLALGESSVKVLCCLGDQGFTNSLQGLVCAVQEAAPVAFLVCNNGGSVSLRKQSGPSGWLDSGRDRYLENAAGMRYTEIAGALGVRAQRLDLSDWLDRDRAATRLEAFALLLEEMVAQPVPTLIELVLPSDPEFWAGVWNTQGFEQQAATGASAAEGSNA